MPTKTVRLAPSGLTKNTQVQQFEQRNPGVTVKSSRVEDGRVVLKVEVPENDQMGVLQMLGFEEDAGGDVF